MTDEKRSSRHPWHSPICIGCAACQPDEPLAAERPYRPGEHHQTVCAECGAPIECNGDECDDPTADHACWPCQGVTGNAGSVEGDR